MIDIARTATAARLSAGEIGLVGEALAQASDDLARWSQHRWTGAWNPQVNRSADTAVHLQFFPAARSAALDLGSAEAMLGTAAQRLLNASADTGNRQAITEALTVQRAAGMVRQLGVDVAAGRRTGQLPLDITDTLRGWHETLTPTPVALKHPQPLAGPSVVPLGNQGPHQAYADWLAQTRVRPHEVIYPDGPAPARPTGPPPWEITGPEPGPTAEQLANIEAMSARIHPRRP